MDYIDNKFQGLWKMKDNFFAFYITEGEYFNAATQTRIFNTIAHARWYTEQGPQFLRSGPFHNSKDDGVDPRVFYVHFHYNGRHEKYIYEFSENNTVLTTINPITGENHSVLTLVDRNIPKEFME